MALEDGCMVYIYIYIYIYIYGVSKPLFPFNFIVWKEKLTLCSQKMESHIGLDLNNVAQNTFFFLKFLDL